MTPHESRNRRILLVDDNPSIHADFRRILQPGDESEADALDAAAALLFGSAAAPATLPVPETPDFALAFALQGAEALELVRAAVAQGQPFALAFVDMRMPPGWDGLTTIVKLWEVDPDLQVVICTAYSDRSWAEIHTTLTARHRWLVLKKPFDKVEVLQLAQALCEKWSLEQMHRQRAAALEAAVHARTEQLRRSIQVKNEFLANVSHELLTPMNGVVGLQDLLADTPLAPDQQDLLTEARQCSTRLLQLLQDILAFNQAEAGTLPLTGEAIAPDALLRDVAQAFAPRAERRGLELRVVAEPDAAVPVLLPRGVLRQLLGTLVDNAVKFTACGHVALRATRTETGVRFAVEDTGPGLTPQQLDWIAVPFAQLDGTASRRLSGMGLGLPLAQRLALSLGGALELRSRPGVGTTAEFAVPCAAAAPTAVAPMTITR